MPNEKKVVIVITPKGWKSTIYYNGKEFSEEHKSTPTGARGVGKSLSDNDEACDEIPEEIIDAVTEGFFAYNVMEALKY